MGLIEERGEGQPKNEGGPGDDSPGGKEEPQNRSRQPDFPSWQVPFSSQTVPREGRAGTGGCLPGTIGGVGGMLPAPKGEQWGSAGDQHRGRVSEIL